VNIVLRTYVFPLLIRWCLRLHSLTYQVTSALAIRLEGTHPKHRLMRYKEWFLEQVRDDDVVLDVGSNIGSMPHLLAQKATFVYGIEIDAKLFEVAHRINAAVNIEYIHADATKLDYSQLRPISIVTLSNVLEHIENRRVFLDELVTRVNWRENTHRRLLIRVPMIDRDWITLYKRDMGVEWRLDPTHFIEYTMDELDGELTQAGLVIEYVNVCFGEAYVICRVA
jgi:hypothetical protein